MNIPLESKKDEREMCVLVDSSDVQIGVAEKFAAHRNPARRHRAASVWLWNDANEVLIQQRSSEKIVGALWWGNTVCGNVRVGETVEECAQRRLLQELSISGVTLQKKGTFEYKAYCNDQYSEHEVDHVFVGTVGEHFVMPIPSEVAAIAWVPFPLLQRSIATAISANNYPTASQTLELSWEELAYKTVPLVCDIAGTNYQFAPWTVFMFQEYFA